MTSRRDYSGEDLKEKDFSGVDLRGVNFSEASLTDADFSGAKLNGADFSDAYLIGADFSDANLNEADFSGARLEGADLSGSLLFNTNISSATLSRNTTIEFELAEIKRHYRDNAPEDVLTTSQMWESIARIYHELKVTYSENGLVGQARNYRILERYARRKEAKAKGGFKGYSAWLGSLLSRIFTGYGVQLRYPAALMLVVYLLSAVVYLRADMSALQSLYYSVVTFTTAPPSPPPNDLVTQATAMVETFIGTLFIVLLGYVLGNREQV